MSTCTTSHKYFTLLSQSDSPLWFITNHQIERWARGGEGGMVLLWLGLVDWVSEYDVDKRAIWWISWTDHNHYKRCHTHSFTCFLIVCLLCLLCVLICSVDTENYEIAIACLLGNVQRPQPHSMGFFPSFLLTVSVSFSLALCSFYPTRCLLVISNELLLFMSPLTHSLIHYTYTYTFSSHFSLGRWWPFSVWNGFTNLRTHQYGKALKSLSLMCSQVYVSVLSISEYETHTHSKNLIALVVKLYAIKINFYFIFTMNKKEPRETQRERKKKRQPTLNYASPMEMYGEIGRSQLI